MRNVKSIKSNAGLLKAKRFLTKKKYFHFFNRILNGSAKAKQVYP